MLITVEPIKMMFGYIKSNNKIITCPAFEACCLVSAPVFRKSVRNNHVNLYSVLK